MDTGCFSADTATVASEMSNCLTSSTYIINVHMYLDLNLGSKKDAKLKTGKKVFSGRKSKVVNVLCCVTACHACKCA